MWTRWTRIRSCLSPYQLRWGCWAGLGLSHLLRVDALVIEQVLEAEVHQSTTTRVVAFLARTVAQLLLGDYAKSTGRNRVYAFHSTCDQDMQTRYLCVGEGGRGGEWSLLSTPVVENAQHEPQWPWFFTGVTAFLARQSTEASTSGFGNQASAISR